MSASQMPCTVPIFRWRCLDILHRKEALLWSQPDTLTEPIHCFSVGKSLFIQTHLLEQLEGVTLTHAVREGVFQEAGSKPKWAYPSRQTS